VTNTTMMQKIRRMTKHNMRHKGKSPGKGKARDRSERGSERSKTRKRGKQGIGNGKKRGKQGIGNGEKGKAKDRKHDIIFSLRPATRPRLFRKIRVKSVHQFPAVGQICRFPSALIDAIALPVHKVEQSFLRWRLESRISSTSYSWLPSTSTGGEGSTARPGKELASYGSSRDMENIMYPHGSRNFELKCDRVDLLCDLVRPQAFEVQFVARPHSLNMSKTSMANASFLALKGKSRLKISPKSLGSLLP